MNDLKGPAAAVNDTKGMAGAAQKTKPASLKRPGDKGTIKKTSSGKFQPQLFINELNTQRALGSYETAEEAAAVLAAANDKMKNKESVFMVPVRQQAKHGTVRCTCPHSALHIHSQALNVLNALTVSLLSLYHCMSQASMSAEERELMEEEQAIKAAQTEDGEGDFWLPEGD